MSEDPNTKPSEESVATSSALRKRKKRKWDEPADLLISPIIAIPGAIPVGIGSTIRTPGVFPLSNVIATNTVLPSITQNVVTLVQKLSQPKVQDEPIAREIIINDAEPTIRYKLTKRQTQEEIQKSTGAVVITRGKYRPPTALPDSEKPLYLHISAGSHLKDMAERIIVVDRAAAMVEEILRQGHNLVAASGPYTVFNSNGQVNQPLSICLFLGFEPDPSQNIAARIRGPNDQYINHIINETGATVVLRGKGSGNHDISHPEEDQQRLHLYLSSTNSKSLEAAKCLAENLLDTISAESGASRVSSSKVYNAVPPPQQLLAGFQISANMEASINPVSSSCAAAGIAQTAQSYASNGLVVSSASAVSTSGVSIQNGILSSNGNPIPNMGSYAYPTVTRGTCYSGYGGIYPQATPLQQVALALKQAPVSTTSVVSSTSFHRSSLPKTTSSSNVDTEKRPPQKRKFQELPVTSKVLPTLNQNLRLGSECFKSGLEDDADAGKFSSIPSPKKLIHPGLGEQLPPPPPRMMIPPPPPKFPSTESPSGAHNHNIRVMPPPPTKLPLSQSHSEAWNQNPVIKASIPETCSPTVKSSVIEKPSAGPVSDTLLKLVEYDEEEEEDVAASAEESCRSNLMICTSSKPFWAV